MRLAKSATATPSALILLVDDNKMGLSARRVVLEELGYTVHTAPNGQEALNAIELNSFDLVITDWKMPKVDGIELIRRLREAQFPSPIVLLSGFADSAGIHEDKTGADAVVQKSANEVQMLISTVKRLLNRKPVRKPPAAQSAAKLIKPKSKSV
ncbi:MAG: response regulator [Chloroflexia bacterium]